MDNDVSKKVADFFSHYPQRNFPKDQIIIFNGEAPEKIFYIVSGKVSQYDISYRGDEIMTNIFKSPAFFPMSWAINHTPNTYFYKADEDTVVYVAPPEEVVTFLKDNPDVTFDLLARVYKGIDGVSARTVHLMSGSARSRIMYELIIECRRFGNKISDNCYELKINETDLAAHAGLARETVNREVKHLKEKGMVEVSGSSITVTNLSQMEMHLGKTA
ncbi:MAG: Crp/Fnr family transcriptional regulator [Candidatus Microsaccharimonas sp.]